MISSDKGLTWYNLLATIEIKVHMTTIVILYTVVILLYCSDQLCKDTYKDIHYSVVKTGYHLAAHQSGTG